MEALDEPGAPLVLRSRAPLRTQPSLRVDVTLELRAPEGFRIEVPAAAAAAQIAGAWRSVAPSEEAAAGASSRYRARLERSPLQLGPGEFDALRMEMRRLTDAVRLPIELAPESGSTGRQHALT